MEKLCDDITSQILIRLPAKNIAQLRCVCRRWYALLREASFIKSHLRRSINNNDEIILLLNPKSVIPFKTPSPRPILSTLILSPDSPDVELINFVKFPVPSDDFYVIGAVNGLICFYVGSHDDDDRVIYVWNPSLSALLTVPPCGFNSYRTTFRFKLLTVPPCGFNSYRATFRFGFDPKNDDYKIIQLVHSHSVNHHAIVLEVKVYSMRSGCWKLITQIPPLHVSCFNYYSDKNVDGHLHWLCSYHDGNKISNIIVAYDLAAESFSEISLPDHIKFGHVSHHMLGVFGGKLCVTGCSADGKTCEMWVKDQCGSWVKNGFSHFHKDGILRFGFTLKNNFIYKDGNLVIHLYNPAAPFNKVKPFQKDKPARRYFGRDIIIAYVDSLVWVTPPPSSPAMIFYGAVLNLLNKTSNFVRYLLDAPGDFMSWFRP